MQARPAGHASAEAILFGYHPPRDTALENEDDAREHSRVRYIRGLPPLALDASVGSRGSTIRHNSSLTNSQANKRSRYYPSFAVGRTSETREFSLCTELLGRGFSEVRLLHAPRRQTCYCSVCGIGDRPTYCG